MPQVSPFKTFSALITRKDGKSKGEVDSQGECRRLEGLRR